MKPRTLGVFLAITAGAVAGCYFTPDGGNGATGAGPGGGSGPTATGSGTAGMSGVPCDVAQALSSCVGCHSSPPVGGAPMSLASYTDLTAQSSQYPGQTEAQRSVARMSGSPSLMPPGGPAPAQADIDTINAWIAAGYPQGSCGSDGGTNPYNTPTVCTSGMTSTVNEGATMAPGEACIACHSRSGEAPVYPLMGTVYPTAHEPNGCVGASSASYSGVQIIATDSAGNTVTLTPNSAGNFMGPSYGGVSGAYTIKITYQGRERDMMTPQTSGDCNACHTETGANGAPGRIMLP